MLNLFYTLKFIYKNKKIYSKTHGRKIVLVELFNYKASIISNGIFANELAKIKKAKIVGYEPNFLNFKRKIKNLINKINIFSCHNLYKSFGLNSIVLPKKIPRNVENEKIFRNTITKIKSKRDILKIEIKSTLIGDLIYDSFLRENRHATIDIKSKLFHRYLKNSIDLFLYWDNYFNNNNVVGLVLSHSVYLTAIPVRIATRNKISVYNAGFSSVYRLTKNKPLKFSYFNEYPKYFKKIKLSSQQKILNIAKKNIKLRLSGKKDLLYNQSQSLKERVYLRKRVKLKSEKNIILIAAHDFTDAPHVHGKMIFNDFYDWIDFLGKKSQQLRKYHWYIKLHPADYEENLNYVKVFLDKYPNLKLLPKNTNHNNLLSKGIICVLTTYGSIAHEYPFFDVPVLNAGENPHSGYNFSITPNNFKKYQYLINNIDKIKQSKKNIKQIYEFYAMYHLVDYNIFEELEFSEKKLNNYYIFNYYQKKFNNFKINKIRKKYYNFIKSKDRRLIKFIN